MLGSVLFGVLLAGLGGLLVFGGGRNLRSARGFRDRALRVTGILVGIRTDRHDDRRTHYPVLRFRTIEGTEVETTSNVNEGPFHLWRTRGRQVPVLYDPANPNNACIDGPSGRGQVRSAIAMMGVGLLFILAGIGYVIVKLG